MAIVSTGQITIVDSNDAKSLVLFISANGSTQQIYNPDTSPAYVPDYTTANLVLTANFYAGSTTEAASTLTSKTWSTSVGGTSLGSGTTLTISANQSAGSAATTYYFQGIYTDPTTGLASTVIAQIQTSIVRTGTNATFIQVTGTDVISTSNTATKNSAYLVASLYRGSTLDDAVTRYKWYKLISGAWQQIYVGNTALNVVDGGTTYTTNTLYGFKLQSDYASTPNTAPTIGSNTQPSATDDTVLRRGIAISERAVTDYGLFKVAVVDGTDTYETTFTVYDISDPYDTQLVSTAGDKLTNGLGSTYIYPRMFDGGVRITDLTGWSFTWTFRDKDGNQAAFINETQTAVADGLNVSSNTTTTITLSLSVANANLVANKVVKLVSGSNVKYYDVASVASGGTTAPVLTLKATPTSGIYTYTAPTTNEFQNGKLFICDYSMSTNGGASETAAQIQITQYEIDSKGIIFCESNRP